MYRQIWAVIRHDLYKDIEAAKGQQEEESKTEKLTDEKFDELYRKNLNNFEQIREEVYEKVIGKKV